MGGRAGVPLIPTSCGLFSALMYTEIMQLSKSTPLSTSNLPLYFMDEKSRPSFSISNVNELA